MNITIPAIRSPTPNINRPTLGWNLSQEIETAKINRGNATISAAKNIAKPTTPFKKPPSKGIYPRIVVIGEKNEQIEKTIKK